MPTLTVPNGFGVNIHFRGQPRAVDLIADAGFKFIRMDLTWEALDREKGVYEFEKSGYDALTTRMLQTRHTHPVYSRLQQSTL